MNTWLERDPDPATKLGATLRFLRVMTLAPDQLGPEDARAVYATGVTPAGLDDAVHVAMMFNVINRIADGLGFDIPSEADFAATAKMLMRFGYEV